MERVEGRIFIINVVISLPRYLLLRKFMKKGHNFFFISEMRGNGNLQVWIDWKWVLLIKLSALRWQKI